MAKEVTCRIVNRVMLRKFVLVVHLWTGLVLGVWFSLLGLTGTLLVFHEAVDARLNPQLLRVTPRPERASLDAVLASARTRAPDARLDRAVAPLHEGGVWEVRYRSQGERFKALVDPHSANLLAVRGEQGYFMGQVLHLHMNLLMGERGETLNGYGGLLVTLLLLTGVYLWWPRTWKQLPMRLKVARGISLKRTLFDLHNLFGIYTLPVLLLVTLTGSAFLFHAPTERLVYALFGAPVEVQETPMVGGKMQRSAQSLVDTAQKVAPEARVERVYPNAQTDEPFSVRLLRSGVWKGDGFVTVDLNASTGQIVRVKDDAKAGGGERVMNWLSPLHFGTWAGFSSQLLWALIGLSPLSLFVTGVWMWGRKKLRKKRAGTTKEQQERRKAKSEPLVPQQKRHIQ